MVLSPKDTVKVSASAGKPEEIKKPKKNTNSAKKQKKVILVAPPEIIDFASLIQGPSKVKKLEEEIAPDIKKEDTRVEPQIDITPKITEELPQCKIEEE